MITQRRSARSKLVARPSILAERRSIASDRLGRLIQIALALYLMPVLLVVLVVSGLLMLIMRGVSMLTSRVRGPWLRGRVGESFTR